MLNGVLYHQALTASSMMDMLACVIHEMLEAEGDQFPTEERNAVLEVVTEATKRFKILCEIRNNLLHGTWFIGWAPQGAIDFPFTAGTVSKFTPSSRGIEAKDKLPKSLDDLKSYVEDAKTVKQFANGLAMCLTLMRCPIGKAFAKRTGVWEPRSNISR
jgi:hypothetical protein